jgi:uncharacterized protein YndB with AHSA1/START domain
MTDTTATELSAIERTVELRAAPERVWRAITDPDELCRWFPQQMALDIRPGAVGTFTWSEYGDFAVRVDAVEPPRYLAWRWAREPNVAADEAFMTLVEWWLTPRDDGGTTLRVRESGFADPEHRSGNEEGWDEELAELAELLGQPGSAR